MFGVHDVMKFYVFTETTTTTTTTPIHHLQTMSCVQSCHVLFLSTHGCKSRGTVAAQPISHMTTGVPHYKVVCQTTELAYTTSCVVLTTQQTNSLYYAVQIILHNKLRMYNFLYFPNLFTASFEKSSNLAYHFQKWGKSLICESKNEMLDFWPQLGLMLMRFCKILDFCLTVYKQGESVVSVRCGNTDAKDGKYFSKKSSFGHYE